MPVALLCIALGGALLWKGGDWLVEGADRFARGRGMPASLAGVFILGFATSAPELAVTVIAAVKGRPGIAVGNVVGSNIANVALILGWAAVIHTLTVDRFLRWIEMPIAVLASVLVYFLFRDGRFGGVDGWIALCAFALYSLAAVKTAPHRPEALPHPGVHRPFLELLLAAFGLACLVLGAHFFVEGATTIARTFGVSEVVIGLTLVAIGTSLPELATTIAAARKGHMEMAVGNIVGSNIFNLLLVLGVAGVLVPQSDASGRLLAIDLPLMTALAFLAWLFAVLGGRIRRWQGFFFLAVYAAYIGLIAIQTIR